MNLFDSSTLFLIPIDALMVSIAVYALVITSFAYPMLHEGLIAANLWVPALADAIGAIYAIMAGLGVNGLRVAMAV